MNAPTISMPREIAQQKLDAYRESLRRRADDEHAALARAYEALAEGTPLLSLQEAITAGGTFEDGRPRLAVARADRRHVSVYSRRAGAALVLAFDARRDAGRWDHRHRAGSLVIELPIMEGGPGVVNQQGYTLVPMIPADVRNRMTGQPKDHFILFEVEAWSDRPLNARANPDPFLLRHLGGDLYAVVDEWDLTEVELLVMQGRREG